jgi:hypothetical protein
MQHSIAPGGAKELIRDDVEVVLTLFERSVTLPWRLGG